MISCLIRQLVPSLRLWAEASCNQFTFVHLKLGQETGSHVHLWSSRVEELESFHETPAEFAHNIGCNNKASSVLSFHGLNQNAFVILNCFLDKFKNLVRNLLLLVEESLLFVILPVESKVENANLLPKIAQLSSSGVNNTRHLVCNDKLQVLKTHKQSGY